MTNLKLFYIQIKWLMFIFYAQLFNKKILFWGASKFLEEFLTKFKIKSNAIVGVVDKNAKNRDLLCGYKVIGLNEIDDFQADFMIFSIRNYYNRIYSEVKPYMQVYSNDIELLKNDFEILDKKADKQKIEKTKKIVKAKIDEINKILSEYKSEKLVYLIQFSFFDRHGKDFYSGGAERYMIDLGKIISQMGYKPVLLQIGDKSLDAPWVRTMQDLTVVGINTTIRNYFKVVNGLIEPELAIYSGMGNWAKDIKYKKTILISHGISWDVPYRNLNLDFLKKTIRNFKYIVSVDTSTICYLRSTFSNYVVENKTKFDYVPNYVDLNKYYPVTSNRNQIKITYPRRCSAERGFWMFAEIIPKLLEHHKDVLIEFVGYIHGDEIKEKLDELIEKYPKNVFHRFVEQDKMYSVYQDTDISIIPTLYAEGTSLSCLEAMACGNTVVATNVGGLPNLIFNNYNGKLINPDAESLYNALDELIINPELRKELSKNAISVSKVFSKDIWQENWKNILKKLLL